MEGAEHQPKFIESTNTDSWLDANAAGRGVGTTAEANAHHHPCPGVVYRPIKDGPRIAVAGVAPRRSPARRPDDLIDAITLRRGESPAHHRHGPQRWRTAQTCRGTREKAMETRVRMLATTS